MSRPRTPTAVLDARGSFRHNPHRKRKDPEVESLFPSEAPSDLEPLEVQCWHRLVKQIPTGVLTGADQAAVHLCAVLWAEFLSQKRDMATARINAMFKVMGDLGLSPASRAKLAVKPEEAVTEW